jgi:hypothetical protein
MEVSMKKILVVTALSTLVLAGAAPVIAHHAFSAEFDTARPLNMRGVFQSMDWVNPHSWVHFEVTMEDGSTVVWAAETPPPNQLIRIGWRRSDLQPDDEIRVTGYAAKNGTLRMWAQNVALVAQAGVELDEPKTVLALFDPNPDGIAEGVLPGGD